MSLQNFGVISRSFEVTRSHSKSFWGHSRLFEVIRSPFEVIRGHSKSLWDHSKSFEVILQSFDIVRSHPRSFEVIRSHFKVILKSFRSHSEVNLFFLSTFSKYLLKNKDSTNKNYQNVRVFLLITFLSSKKKRKYRLWPIVRPVLNVKPSLRVINIQLAFYIVIRLCLD